jgi:hypothetical protein
MGVAPLAKSMSQQYSIPLGAHSLPSPQTAPKLPHQYAFVCEHLNIPYPIWPFEGNNDIGIFYQELNKLVQDDTTPPFPKEDQWKLFEAEPDWCHFTACFDEAVYVFNSGRKNREPFLSFKFPTHMANLFNLHEGWAAKRMLVENLDDDFHHIGKASSAPEAQQTVALPAVEFSGLF